MTKKKWPYVSICWFAGSVNIPFVYLNLQQQSYILVVLSCTAALFCFGMGLKILLDH